MIRDDLISALRGALEALDVTPLPERIEIEQPARREHGDWSSNVALASAKAAGRNPRELAADIVAHLEASPPTHVAGVEIAGPGFVNFRLHETWLHEVLADVVAGSVDGYATHDFGQGGHTIVEFVSSNPNKPLHAGHARGAMYGDSVSRLLERCGFKVTREYYLNDRGVQMQKFAESLAARKRGEAPPDDGYQGDYLIEWAEEMPDDADPYEWGLARGIQSHRDTLARVDVHHDVWFSERSMVGSGAIEATLDELAARGKTFEDDGALWLRSTDYGDDKDRVLRKSDGDLTYLAPDIAYHRDKFSRAPKLLNVFGADHHGYIARMKAAMAALGHDADELEIIITQLVDLMRNNEPVRMSGRLGDMVAIDDIIDEIGPDAARFTYLMQSMDTRQTIDLTALAEKSMDNPVFYVQYAHARIYSLAANATSAGVERLALADVDLSVLTHERELEMLRELSQLPNLVAVACREREPHKIASWARDMAAAFHGFYHDCYVVGDGVSADQTQARLWLIEAARTGIVIALGLLGVSAPDEM